MFVRPLLLALATISLFGCKKNAGCTKFGSENYDHEAIIDDGSCIAARDKFLGTFRVYSDCSSTPYYLTVSESTDEYEVTISKLADTLNDVNAQVFGQNITIEPQAVGTGVSVEGAGVSLQQDTLELSIRIRDTRNGTLVIHDCFERCFRE